MTEHSETSTPIDPAEKTFQVDASTTLKVTGNTTGAEQIAQQMRAGNEASGTVDRGILRGNTGVVETTPQAPTTPEATPKNDDPFVGRDEVHFGPSLKKIIKGFLGGK